jgi:hypothetical protein
LGEGAETFPAPHAGNGSNDSVHCFKDRVSLTLPELPLNLSSSSLPSSWDYRYEPLYLNLLSKYLKIKNKTSKNSWIADINYCSLGYL